MFYKLHIFYKVNKSLSIFIMPIFFILVNFLVLLTVQTLSDSNVGVVFTLFGPIMFISILTKIITTEYKWGFSEIQSSYRTNKLYIFIYKYLLGLVVFSLALFISLLMLNVLKGDYNLYILVRQTLCVTFAVGNFAMFISIRSQSYEQGLIAGLISVIGIVRIKIPLWIFSSVFPLVAFFFCVISIYLFIREKY